MPLNVISGIDRRSWILQNCKIGEQIIDIGSSDGWIFRGTDLQKYVTSIDIDLYQIPNFYRINAEKLKFPDKTFDVAILGEILEHVEDPVQILKEAKRVAKRILITTPDEANWDPRNFPYETLEEQTKRRNLTVEEIARVSNPNAIEFHNDNFNHLFHRRHYVKNELIRDLKSANIKNYKLEHLIYGDPQWAFFTVDANCEQPINSQQETVLIKRGIESGPVINHAIQSGPIINYGLQQKIQNNQNQNQNQNQTKKLRIALISTPFFTVPPKSYGGLEQVVWDLAMGLDALNHEVTIFGPAGSKKPPHGDLIITGPSIDTVGVDWFEEEKKRYNVYKDLVTPEKYDIIHDHSWFSFIYLLKMNKNNPKLRILHTHHGGMSWDSPPPPPIKPNLVAISKWMKQYTEEYFKQKGFNIHVENVYNGIDLDKYTFQATKTDHLLFVGRLSTFKQPHIAIEVARKSNHKLDIVGGSTFVDSIAYVQNLEKDVENDPDITLYENASHKLKIEKLKAAKALIFPSKMAEPMGLVAIEAMSCGTPVIATRDGAIPEIVLDGITGYICDTEEQMVACIDRIHEIKPEDCRKRAELFSRLNMAKDYQELYYKVMNNEDW